MNILKSIKFKNVPYAICTSNQVTHKPLRVSNMVLYRKKEDNTIVCLEDACPHRGARLSQGWTNQDDEIVCPYHGWSFDTTGHIASMPSHEQSMPNCIVPYIPVVEDGEYVWINYKEDLIDKYCPELNDKNWGKIVGSREVEGNWFDWVSNSWDVSHINFVHDFGDEKDAIVHDFKTWEDDELILNAQCKVNPKPVNFATKHMQKKKAEITVKTILPNITRIDVHMKKPHKFITFTTIMPVSIDKSILTWSFLWNFGNTFWEKSVLIKDEFEKEMNKTISEDEEIIKYITNDIPYISVPADALQLKATQVLNDLIQKHEVSSLTF